MQIFPLVTFFLQNAFSKNVHSPVCFNGFVLIFVYLFLLLLLLLFALAVIFYVPKFSIYASRAEVYIWQLTHSIHPPKTDGGFFFLLLSYYNSIFSLLPSSEKHFSCGMERKYYARKERVLFTRLRFIKSAHLNVAISVAGVGCLMNNYCEIFLSYLFFVMELNLLQFVRCLPISRLKSYKTTRKIYQEPHIQRKKAYSLHFLLLNKNGNYYKVN